MIKSIPRFIMVPSGVYNPPVHRTYTVDGRDLNNVERLTREATNEGRNLSPGAMTSLASKIIMPSASLGEVYIPNSFSEKRFRFMMEVEFEDGLIQYLSGYTDKLDQINGHLAPDTRLFFNMSYTVRRNTMIDENGHRRQGLSIMDASQILTAPVMDEQNALGGINSTAYGNTAVTMRPSDVFSISAALTASDQMNAAAREQGDSTRIKLGNTSALAAMFPTGIRKSRMRNTLASSYLSDTLGAYVAGEERADNQAVFYSKWDQASSALAEPTMGSDNFFTPVTNIGHKLRENGSVEWSELLRTVPDIAEQARRSIEQSAKAQVLNGMNGEYASANTPEGMACSKILNGLPAIMGGSFITKVVLFARSGVAAGVGGTAFASPRGVITPNALVDVLNMQSFGRAQAGDNVCKTIAGAFMNEILADLSKNFMLDVTIQVTVDLLGDSEVSISFNTDHPTVFFNPTFCNALSSPIVSRSQDSLSQLASDFTSIFKGAYTPSW